MSKPYNGHPSHAAWNVSLWIGNDEGLYRLAQDCYRHARNGRRGRAWNAAEAFIDAVGTDKTPDGVRWSRTTVARAIAGLFGPNA